VKSTTRAYRSANGHPDVRKKGTLSAATYDYDPRNRLTAATLPGGQSYSFTYNDADELLDKVYPNGVTTSHGYQANGPVTGITATGPTGTVLDLHYTYDGALNIATQTDGDGLHDYSYDGLDRLTAALRPAPSPLPDEAYDYDGVGNRADPTDPGAYDYDANHRIQASPGLTYSFDAGGNTIARSDGATFDYDKLDRLSAFSHSATTAQYAYNPRNQRIRKTVDGATTWFLWAEGILLAEYDGTGSRTRRYDTLPGDYLPTQMDTGIIVFIHGDHLQTPRAITDATGTVVWRSRHKAFGRVVIDDDPDGDGTAVEFHHRFPGQYEDEESGLYYNWNRYYSPETGRYITSDPIGLQGGG
jgi:RHS repeat-associated protein